ncbi:MAG: SDR family oxidoreductase [Pirellulales bacterium]|nr:SDR family oxidoreductase [Pirellulales bacterium]
MNEKRDLFSLDGKVIIVTGGTRKYGYHMCGALVEAGGTVILTSREKARAQAIADEIGREGGRILGYELSLEDDESIDRLVADVISDHGKIDVLVNNARHIPRMPGADINRMELDLLFTVNCSGVILLTRSVAEEMKKTGGGNIINIGSIYGMVGQDLGIYDDPEKNYSWDYPFQKGGMIAYTKQVATVLARFNIRCNCLSLAGLLETAPDDPVFLQRYCEKTPLRRMANADDVKGPIVFLASDASSYMTGANLVIDGGWTAW